jgi:hypothetical protein
MGPEWVLLSEGNISISCYREGLRKFNTGIELSLLKCPDEASFVTII